jgi:prephenate dehydratase
MALSRIVVFRGKRSSQAGLATRQRFPYLIFEGNKESFDEIITITKKEDALGIMPIWNSHEGEIKDTKLFPELFDQNIHIYYLWPANIQFLCLRRKVSKGTRINSIISVKVARKQCSIYLRTQNITNGTFFPEDSTPDAFDKFTRSNSYDAVLCTPDTVYDTNIFYEENKDVANPYNFTTFVILGNVHPNEWKNKQWGKLKKEVSPSQNNLIGVEMEIPGKTLTDEQNEFFDQIFEQSKDINSIPKAIFIWDRTSVDCGMLFETSKDISFFSAVTEEKMSERILVKDDLGETKGLYINEISQFIKGRFPRILKGDFIKHIGEDSCFFACPTFNIMTHGFNEHVVEVIVRAVIFKCFELIDKKWPCTKEQIAFFKKYEKEYRQGDQFISFSVL